MHYSLTRDILDSPIKENRALTEVHAKFITAQNESPWHDLAELLGFSNGLRKGTNADSI